MITPQNTVIVIGDSPFIGEVENVLYYIVDRYPSIGINHVIKKFKVQTHVFQDMKFIPITNSYPNIKTVSINQWGDAIQKENKELFPSFPFDFRIHTENDIYRDGRLAWEGFTHDYAISYCIYKGYENIILVGAADFVEGSHHMTREIFKFSDSLREKSKKFIEEICTKRACVYKVNPKSILNIPAINLDELLK